MYRDIAWYDIEVYRNFFCIVFQLEDGNSIEVVMYNDQITYYYNGEVVESSLKQLKDYLSEKLLIGYNSKHYDNIILKKFLGGYTNSQLKDTSDVIITGDGVARYKQYPWESMDLMKSIFNVNADSLKLMGCKLNHNKLQELPIDPDVIIEDEDVDTLIKYCRNDVEITKKLFEAFTDGYNLRLNQGEKHFDNPYFLLSESDSGIANRISEKAYEELTNIPKAYFRNDGTLREDGFYLGECIHPDIEFSTPEFKRYFEYIKNVHYLPGVSKNKDVMNFEYKGMSYSLGFGGIHSEDGPAWITPNENEILRDADVASQYPAAIIIHRIIAKHLDDILIDWYEGIRDDRIVDKKKYKETGDKKWFYDQWSKKITLNSFFGKYNSPYSWLYDPLKMVEVTINNQLRILMLIEMLDVVGIDCVSANTDGIVCKFDKFKDDIYYGVCKQWEHKTQFVLEYADYSAIIRSNVNNYIAIETNGSIKTKGEFSPKQELNKGYKKNRIVSLALNKYFVEGVDPEEFIKSHNNIYDFCSAERVGKQFKVYYGSEETQRINRYFVSTNGEELTKVKYADNQPYVQRIVADRNVTLFNDYFEAEDYHIDYEYYINETYKVIDRIMNKYLFIVEMDGVVKHYHKRGKTIKPINKLKAQLEKKGAKVTVVPWEDYPVLKNAKQFIDEITIENIPVT